MRLRPIAAATTTPTTRHGRYNHGHAPTTNATVTAVWLDGKPLPKWVDRIAVGQDVVEVRGRSAPVDDVLQGVRDDVREQRSGRRREQEPLTALGPQHHEDDEDHNHDEGKARRTEEWVDTSKHEPDDTGRVVEPAEHGNVDGTR